MRTADSQTARRPRPMELPVVITAKTTCKKGRSKTDTVGQTVARNYTRTAVYCDDFQ